MLLYLHFGGSSSTSTYGLQISIFDDFIFFALYKIICFEKIYGLFVIHRILTSSQNTMTSLGLYYNICDRNFFYKKRNEYETTKLWSYYTH